MIVKLLILLKMSLVGNLSKQRRLYVIDLNPFSEMQGYIARNSVKNLVIYINITSSISINLMSKVVIIMS